MGLLRRLSILGFAAFAFSAHAGPNFESTIHEIGERGVTLSANESMPDWMQVGTTVTALGWEVDVLAVDGQRVVLDMAPSKLKRAKVGDPVSIREPGSTEPQMCGA